METEVELKAFKTKVKINSKEQFDYLMKTAKACRKVKNWYVDEALKRMKKDGVTIFSPKKELEKYAPRELSKVLTTLINTTEEFAWLKGIPSVPRTQVFEHIKKTYSSTFIPQCWHEAKSVEERIEKLKEAAKKENIELTEEDIKRETVFYPKGGNRSYKPDNLYKVKGFPRFENSVRHMSFHIDNVIVDAENKCLILPSAIGNKKFNVPKMEGIKISYFDWGFNPEGVDKTALFTFSYDGEDWWVSVKQKMETAKACAQKERTVVLGVDMGLKNLVYVSNGQILKDITEHETIKRITKKRQFLTAERSKNFEKSPLGTVTTDWGKEVKIKSAKYKKLTKSIKHLDNKLLRIKDALIKEQVASLDLSNVKGVVFEDFKIEFMKHNKKMSSKVQRIGLGYLRQGIKDRCKQLGIKVMKAPVNYASTQICSKCGKQNLHMKDNLKERTFKCEFCDNELDRDLNAAINLANLWGSDILTEYK